MIHTIYNLLHTPHYGLFSLSLALLHFFPRPRPRPLPVPLNVVCKGRLRYVYTAKHFLHVSVVYIYHSNGVHVDYLHRPSTGMLN
jgi:hypothetical protein